MSQSSETDQERLLNEADLGSIHSDEQVRQADSTIPRQTDLAHERICRRIYLSHILSTWNSRVFEFAAFLFLAKIYPHTLLPASVYALARAASAALFSPWLGSYIDQTDRLKAVRLSILGQRLPVILSCLGFFALLLLPQWAEDQLGEVVALLSLSSLACVEKLSAVLNTISVERDWVVVIAETDEARLTTINARMRRIDLFCKLVGPLSISLVESYSTESAIVATATMSGVSVLTEYFAIARVYHAMPALQSKKADGQASKAPQSSTLTERLFAARAVLSSYFRHPAFLPSFALALLYLTALSFSGQFITYLLAQDIGSANIALFRAAAAIFEMSATWLGPWLNTRIGAVRSGIWFLNAELVFIVLSCALLWLPVNNTHGLTTTLALVLMVILSRTGLWSYDLSAQIIIQDEVEPSMRGTFSSLEASFQNMFEMLAFLSTVIFPRPEQFKYPAVMSAVAVATAALLYAYFVRSRRGHLFHRSRCLDRHASPKLHRGEWQAVPLEDLHDEADHD